MLMAPCSLEAAELDAGTIMRDLGDQLQKIPETPKGPLIAPRDSASVVSTPGASRIMVNRIRITGATMYSEAGLGSELTGYTGRELTVDELHDAAQRLESFYARKGYFVRALIPEQDVRSGEVEIQVIESRLGKVSVEKSDGVRLSAERAKSYVTSSQKQGNRMKIKNFERGLLLLQQLPGVRSSAAVHRGDQPGSSDVQVTLEKVPLVSGTAGIDNHGGIATGERRGSVSVNVNSPLKIGDQMSVKGLYTEGISYGRVQYMVPLGYHGIRAGLYLSTLDYKLGGAYQALNATGDSRTAGGLVAMPLVLRRHSSLYGTMSYDYRQFTDKAVSVVTGDKSVRCGTVSLSGSWSDELFGGAYTMVGATGSFGNLDLSRLEAVRNYDQAGARTSGGYEKLMINISRIQQIHDPGTRLTVSVSGQLSSGNLDSSEKFILGGPNGVRAYPVSEGSGDDGMLATVELRKIFSNEFHVFGFYDYGTIRRYSELYPSVAAGMKTPNTYSLDGVGVGVVMRPLSGLFIKSTVSTRLRSNPAADLNGNDHDGTKRKPRLWVDATYAF
jgi:hemolysin activation/secretion protein